MHRLRPVKLGFQCRLLSGRVGLSVGHESQHAVLRPGARKRRWFSDFKADDTYGRSASAPDRYAGEQELENYTSDVLRSHRVPLGTMSLEEWEVGVDAFTLWVTQMGSSGYAIDSAERLMRRAQCEMFALSTAAPEYNTRMNKLMEMRRTILQCWLTLHDRHPTSMLALDRSERLFLSILETDLKDDADSFPIAELFNLIDGFLNMKASEGTQRAGRLILSSTADPHYPYLTDHTAGLSIRFDRTVSAVLAFLDQSTANTLSTHLLDRMKFLRNEVAWPEMELSPATLKALEDAAFKKFIDESAKMENTADQTTKAVAVMSSFEASAMQKRMTEMIQKAGVDDQQNIANIIARIEAMESASEDLVLSLADYYLRLDDVANASSWMLRLSPTTVFSKNSETGHGTALIDRILDAWALQSHPRAPWRAEEIFRQILDGLENETAVSLPTLNRFLRIWSGSTDPAANRKIREWFFQMTDSMGLKPDATSICLVLDALDENASAIDKVFALVLDNWTSFNQSEKQAIADLSMDIFWGAHDLPPLALNLLARFKGDKLDVSQERHLRLLHKAFMTVEEDLMLDTIEKLNTEAGIDCLTLYEAAIYSLIKRDAKRLRVFKNVWKSAFEKALKSGSILESDSLSAFLNHVMKMFTSYTHYGHGEAFLAEAERVILPLVVKNEGKAISPIPLNTYKRLIVRKWYREQTAQYVIQLCERLEALHREGYTNLQPDQDVYLGYLKATAVVSSDLADLESILHQMISLYEHKKDDSCKPHTEAFFVLLLCINKMSMDSELAKKKSLELWNQLLHLNIIPDAKTINLVMRNVIKGNDPKSTYSKVMKLFQNFEDFNLEPDSYTCHAVISACGTVKSNERKEALEICLKMFGAIRKQGATSVATYASLTKSLRHLLYRVPIPIADKVATSTLELCYRDGLLAPEVKEAYKSIISKDTWKQIYGQHLLDNNKEPEKWRSNLKRANNAN